MNERDALTTTGPFSGSGSHDDLRAIGEADCDCRVRGRNTWPIPLRNHAVAVAVVAITITIDVDAAGEDRVNTPAAIAMGAIKRGNQRGRYVKAPTRTMVCLPESLERYGAFTVGIQSHQTFVVVAKRAPARRSGRLSRKCHCVASALRRADSTSRQVMANRTRERRLCRTCRKWPLDSVRPVRAVGRDLRSGCNRDRRIERICRDRDAKKQQWVSGNTTGIDDLIGAEGASLGMRLVTCRTMYLALSWSTAVARRLSMRSLRPFSPCAQWL